MRVTIAGAGRKAIVFGLADAISNGRLRAAPLPAISFARRGTRFPSL
jgi:hypothetical protein